MKRRSRKAIAFSAPGRLPRYTRARRERIDVYRCAAGCGVFVHSACAYCERCSAGPLNLPAPTRQLDSRAAASIAAILLVLAALATLATSTREDYRAEVMEAS